MVSELRHRSSPTFIIEITFVYCETKGDKEPLEIRRTDKNLLCFNLNALNILYLRLSSVKVILSIDKFKIPR